MRACVFKAPGAPLEVVAVPDPQAGRGEIVVRVKNCGICGSDLHAAGVNGVKMPPGAIMGHEFSGVIDEIGEGVSGFERGDPVVVMSYLACGECDRCRAGESIRCRAMKPVGFGDVAGGYAEKMKTRSGGVFKMPKGMSFRAGATVEPLVVGFHGVRRARFQAGETCVIMGAGAIGLVTLLWARFAGARAIVVSEVVAYRRELALKMGADAAVDPRMRNPSAEIARITGAGPDVVFECIGAPGTLAEAITYAQRDGRVGVLGASMQDDGFPPGIAMAKQLDVYFSLGIDPGEIETAIAVLASGRISTEAMITHTVSLDELPRAFAALAEPVNQAKVMLEF
jgi:(R,R)-butanediol dehydrogenase/meso-butanediol dehydrogenase/diacetyl reductase